MEKNAYMVYTLFLGSKKGKPIKINSIEKLFTNEVTSAKSVVRYTTGVPRKFKNQKYKAFMKLDNGIKFIWILTGPVKNCRKELMNMRLFFAQFYNKL